jgi:CHAT domain-containing protein
MQAYNLYFSLHQVAESKSQPNLDVAIWREAVAISDSTFDILLRAAAHSYLGKAATAAKMPELALHELSAASKEFASAPPNQASRVARAEAETRLAGVELLTGNGRGALARLMAIQPEVQGASDNLLALLFYRTLGEIKFQSGDPQEAENAERAAVALAELNLGSLRTKDERLRWGLEARGAYETLVALTLHSDDPQEALELWEWYRGASLRSGKEPLAVKAAELKENPLNPRPSEVHARLAGLTSESVISYAVLPDGISVWFFDNRGIVHHWVPISKDRVTLQALSFHRLCSDSASDLAELRTSARNLYDLLIAPIKDRIAADRVLVVEADDALNSIPFEALIDGDGRYLVERTPIVSSYGLYYSNLLRSAPPLSAAAPTLVVGVSAPSGPDDYSLPPLVEAAAEAKAVASNFQSPMLLVDKDVDSGSLIKYLSSARVFHFAGHAVASPKRVGLLLADSTLSADALQGAKLSHLELAVLSACETANGSDGTPVDPNSLIRSFEGSGVPHVVASRWRLDSSAARLFMEIFYSALLQGNTVPRAMQLSENALRNTAGMNRPYFWAALNDFGRS